MQGEDGLNQAGDASRGTSQLAHEASVRRSEASTARTHPAATASSAETLREEPAAGGREPAGRQ